MTHAAATVTRLTVTFPLDRYTDYEPRIRHVLGGPVDSGAGFGMRDLAYEYPSRLDAEEARDKVHALKLAGLAWDLVDVEEEDA